MTSLQQVYDAFLSKVTDDEYAYWTREEIEADLFSLLSAALSWFKFPRVDLTIVMNDPSGPYFEQALSMREIQIIATYMKCEWLNRTILTWENVKPLYEEKDFSQANLIDKFSQMLLNEKENARKLEAVYYRSINGRPFDFTQLAGGE